jgi:hypothetical protein
LKLHNAIIFIGTFIIIINLLIAIFFIRKEKPYYYKFLFIFIFVGLLISLNSIINILIKPLGNQILPITERLLLLVQFFLVAKLYKELLKKSLLKKTINNLFYLSILVQITLVSISIFMSVPSYTKIGTNAFLILFSVFYYRDLLTNKPKLIILKSSTFWLVTGIFFSFSISFPVYALIPFLSKFPDYNNIKYQLFSISNIALIVMYLFFIKSYLCLKHPQNY